MLSNLMITKLRIAKGENKSTIDQSHTQSFADSGKR
jgi:hypothetical protein